MGNQVINLICELAAHQVILLHRQFRTVFTKEFQEGKRGKEGGGTQEAKHCIDREMEVA